MREGVRRKILYLSIGFLFLFSMTGQGAEWSIQSALDVVEKIYAASGRPGMFPSPSPKAGRRDRDEG